MTPTSGTQSVPAADTPFATGSPAAEAFLDSGYDPSVSDTLGRFKTAQANPRSGFTAALRELRAGQKRTHWIWSVFPQLAGLGASPMAVTYGLRDVDEATAYLQDPLLREHG